LLNEASLLVKVVPILLPTREEQQLSDERKGSGPALERVDAHSVAMSALEARVLQARVVADLSPEEARSYVSFADDMGPS
jgi:hypothetical protein